MVTPFFAMRQQAKPDDGWRQVGANSWRRTNAGSPSDIARWERGANNLKAVRSQQQDAQQWAAEKQVRRGRS